MMVAAYVCYKVAGIMGAVVVAGAIFLPSFMLMLSVLPMFECVRTLMVVSLMQMAPHALPDPWAIAMLIGTLIALLAWRIGVLKLMMAGAGLGVLRSRLLALPGARAIF